jgi:hypothetical protein
MKAPAGGAYLAYLAQSAFFFRPESAGRGAYLAYLAQSAFFFRPESSLDIPNSKEPFADQLRIPLP